MDLTVYMNEVTTLYTYIGPVGTILVLLSILSLTLIVVKVITFMVTRHNSSEICERSLHAVKAGDLSGAIKAIQAQRGFVPNMMYYALTLKQVNWQQEEIEADVKSRVTAHFTKLSKYNRTLELIGLIAPLLGLLGTILGMISAFQALQTSGSQADPSVLAGGIWEALLTTALGLCVAMPAIIAFNMIEARLERVKTQTYAALERFFIILGNVKASAPQDHKQNFKVV